MADQAAAQPAQPGPGPVAAPPGPQGNLPALLALPELRLQFGRLNSTRARVNVTIDPAALSRVFTAEYDAASSTLAGFIAPGLNLNQYIQMSRTLVLKRLMDIHEYQTGTRPNAVIQLARGFDIPRPTAELLYALGPYFCPVNGKQYHLTYPAAPQVNPPAWYALDNDILRNYRLFVDQIRERYDTLAFPKMSDMNGQPLMLTRGAEANNMKSVRASLNLPTPADAFLRFVHEDEMIADNVPDFDDCALQMTETLYTSDVITRYTRSYVKGIHL